MAMVVPDVSVDDLILSCQGGVERVARKWLAHRYEDARNATWEDLVSIGMVAVCEAVRQDATKKPGYYIKAAENRIIGYYRDKHDDLIRCSRTEPRIIVESLDAPKSYDDGNLHSLLDVIEGECTVTVPAATSRSYEALYEVLDRLPVKRREAICLRFGLRGHGEHSMKDVASELGLSYSAAWDRVDTGIGWMRSMLDGSQFFKGVD